MFINDRIITKKVDLKDIAAKASQPKTVRSLDEILAEIDAKNKAVKTAGTTTKTASVQPTAKAAAPVAAPVAAAPKAEPKVATASTTTTTNTSTVNVEVKVAGMPDFIKEKIEEKKGDGEKGEDKKDDKKDDKPAFMGKKEEEKACSASANKTLKVAKKLDFRGWNAEEVVAAWGQHGSMDKCVANVNGKTSDPKTYCGLLQIASVEAGKMVKAASTEAAKAAPKPAVFKKIAKLTEKEKSFLNKYYTKLYGSEYVNALLENY